jgi:hypothetical protein
LEAKGSAGVKMKMEWVFEQIADFAGGHAVMIDRIITKGEISEMEIFVREVLQNSLDAALLGKDNKAKPVHVHFRFRRLDNRKEKDSFLEALGWGAIKQHLDACNRYHGTQQRAPMFHTGDELEKTPFTSLEISDSGTIGLIGPETIASERADAKKLGGQQKTFFALVRDNERREKQNLGAGGTYGLGKAVLWASSQIATVLFYSRLSAPFKGITCRAAAQSRMHLHYLPPDCKRSGRGYGGRKDEGNCIAIRDVNARSWAKQIGLYEGNEADEAGTTIVIPFWKRPGVSAACETLDDHVLIARFAARYFWPAIVEKRLVVTTESADGKRENAEAHCGTYKPFMDLYERVTHGTDTAEETSTHIFKVVVPAFPALGYNSEKESFVKVAVKEVNESDVSEDFCRTVALIRGQGMVIGYWRATGGKTVKPYVGLALGGRAVGPSDSGIYGDLLLGFAEGVTHTSWRVDSPNLDDWEDGKLPIRKLLQSMKNYFEENTAPIVPRSNKDLSVLEECLTFPGDDGGDTPPRGGGGPHRLHLKPLVRENGRYLFEIDVTVPKGQAGFTFDISILAGLETEGAGSTNDRFNLSVTELTPKGLTGLKVEDVTKRLRVTIPRVSKDTKIKIEGATETIDADLFKVSLGVLRAVTRKERSSVVTAEAAKAPNELEDSE